MSQQYKSQNSINLTKHQTFLSSHLLEHSHTNRTHKQGGALLTYIKNISFSQLNTSNPFPIEQQIVKIHLLTSQQLHITNMYCTFHPAITNRKRLNYIQHAYNHNQSSKHNHTADDNAHSSLWYSPTEDYRGELIEDILLNSNHIALNENTPTRLPPN